MRLTATRVASLIALLASCTGSVSKDPSAPFRLIVVTGDAQSAVRSTAVPVAPRVRVLNAAGESIAGVDVRFVVIDGGGSALPEARATDVHGEAHVDDWLLGPQAGNNQLRAEVDGVAPVVFSATAIVNPSEIGSPTTTGLVEGDGQSALVGTPVAIAPRILVTDGSDNPIAGVEVLFTVIEGAGIVSPASRVTGPDGTAAPDQWLMGLAVGVNRLRAEVPGLAPIFFRANATPDAAGAFVIVSGNNQNGSVGQALGEMLRVRLTTQAGAPRANQSVTFSTTNGTVAPLTVQTNSAGEAAASWTLGATQGTQSAQARVDDLPALTFTAYAFGTGTPNINTVQTVATLGGRPWGIGFLPDGTMLITLRGGSIVALRRDAAVATGYDPQPVQVAAAPPGFNAQTQSGHLGLAVDPSFDVNGYVFTYASIQGAGSSQPDNRVLRWRRVSASNAVGFTLQLDATILSGISWGDNGGHSGGRIKMGTDGIIWVSTGDVRNGSVPQNVGVLGGKVLRITRTGDPAPGNPDLGPGSRPEIYFYGIRNPNGLTLSADGSTGYLCEHGPSAPQADEVTKLSAGGNGGWDPSFIPCTTPSTPYCGTGPQCPCEQPSCYCGYNGRPTTMQVNGDVVEPLWGPTAAGMSGCDFLRGARWQGWEGMLMVGFLAGERLAAIRINGTETGTSQVVDPARNVGLRVREVISGPDEAVYLAEDESNGRILRIQPQ